MKKLKHRHLYRLSSIPKKMWQVGHPHYGTPSKIVGLYLGYLKGSRNWHGFEIRVKGKEKGVIFMPDNDLEIIKVEDLGLYTTEGV
jgi:hypothetical protein